MNNRALAHQERRALGGRVEAAVTRVQLDVPGLIDRPAVGTTCCASTAEAIVAQELTMLPGIADISIDLKAAKVAVTFDPEAVDLEQIRASLEEIGYPATAA